MVFGKYFTLKETRKILDIGDTVDDEELNILGESANQTIDTELLPYVEKLPLTGDLFTMATKTANYRVSCLWKAKKKNFEAANFYEKMFREQMALLKVQAQSTPTVRTKRVAVATDYKTTPLFSQTKRF